MTHPNELSKNEKILLFLHEYGKGGKTRVRYEDIVVGLFKKYPQDFHLKGYTEYPDSGDLIHKPLYDFKKKGYINAVNKVFSLTERGVELAHQLEGKDSPASHDRLSRSTETEVSRVKTSEGFHLFAEGEKEKLSENDFYHYLGATARTQKNAFIGRLETMDAVVKELNGQNDNPLYAQVIAYHEYLTSKHADLITFFTKN